MFFFKFRRKCTWFILFFCATLYSYISLVLFDLLQDGESHSQRTQHQKAIHKDFQFGPALGETPCVCSEWMTVALSERKKKPQQTFSSDELLDVYQLMKISYPQYVWTHTGWNEHYEITYDPNEWSSRKPLEVFVVLHSHNDPGWKSTYSSYYAEKTRQILRHVLNHLRDNPQLKFCWTEVTYLKHWYLSLSPDDQGAFMKILHNGQLEILSGGYVMADEAVSDYAAVLDQLMEGHQWLHNELNYTVHHGMAIDPFGHSPTMAYLLNQAGISDVIIQRAHFALKRYLAFKRQLEFNWVQHWDSSFQFPLLTHLEPFLLYSIVYSCGPDIDVCCQLDFDHKKCWSWGKYQDPQPITDENIHRKATAVLNQFRKKSQLFNHNKLLVLHGDDFRFNTLNAWNKHIGNLRLLFSYMNNQTDMHVRIKFATPGEYLEAAKSNTLGFPSLSGDFFTYNDRGEQYWSGFFSSRPFLKSAIRRLQHQLRAAEILFSLSVLSPSHDGNIHDSKTRPDFLAKLYSKVQQAREISALMQHHDAVTGTSTQYVAKDYLESIHTQSSFLLDVMGHLTAFLTLANVALPKLPTLIPLEERKGYDQMLTSVLIENFPINVMVHNPSISPRTEVVRLRVVKSRLKVSDAFGGNLPCQLNPIVRDDGSIDEEEFEVLFQVKMAPLSLSSFLIRESSLNGFECTYPEVKVNTAEHKHSHNTPFNVRWVGMTDFFIENSVVRASFCKCTSLLQGILTKEDSIPHRTRMKFVTYGTGSWMNPMRDKSGAYVFLPDGDGKDLVCNQASSVTVVGKLASSVTTFLPLVKQTVSLYNIPGPLAKNIHIENDVNLSNQNNSELAMRIETGVRNGPLFFTDLNGFQVHKRKYQSRLHIQGNFYPMTSMSFIEDQSQRVSLLSAQSHGVSSQGQGQLEVILDRRLMQDDWRGLNEGLTDTLKTRSTFLLLVEDVHSVQTPSTAAMGYPSFAAHFSVNALNHPALLFRLPDNPPTIRPLTPLFRSAIPCDYRLLNFRAMDSMKSFLIVLHRVAASCDIPSDFYDCSREEAKIFMNQLFSEHEVIAIDEMNITGTKSRKRLQMKLQENNRHFFEFDIPPMEIRTYKVTIR